MSQHLVNKGKKLAPMLSINEDILPHTMLVSKSNSVDHSADEKPEDPNKKDKYGTTKALRTAINRQYEFEEILGKGSYGCVSKAVCKTTGRIVALKVMEN
jgi:hypothetical protein